MDRTSRDSGAVRSVAAALAIAELLDGETPVRITELGARLGLAPSTVHRLLATLVSAGWARRTPDRRYVSGPKLGAVRPPQPTRRALVTAARPVLRWLAQASGEAAHLAVLEGTSVVAVDHAHAARPDVPIHASGTAVPPHATAVGVALLAHHPATARAILQAGLQRWTDATPANAAAFRRHLHGARRRGYAVNLRGWIDETAGVAAPVLAGDGTAIASVGISGPAARVARRAEVARLGVLARRAAEEIAARLDGSPSAKAARGRQ